MSKDNIAVMEEDLSAKNNAKSDSDKSTQQERSSGSSGYGRGGSSGGSYAINYNSDQFKQVEADKQAALTENENLYGGMVDNSDQYYQAQIDATQNWEKTQTDIQNQQTDFAIEQIEQQKEQAQKDYTKEQSGAYVDWQKQSGEYGINAEQEAASGMRGTGFSESSQVSMFNAYQNRVSSARESFNLAILNYNNAIKEARLQNNSALAEIAFKSLQQSLELSLQGFQYKNQLLLDQASKKLELEKFYQDRWQSVLDQINTENALAEQIRQFNASLAEEQRQFDAQMALQTGDTGGSSGGGSRSGGGNSYNSSRTIEEEVDLPSSTLISGLSTRPSQHLK